MSDIQTAGAEHRTEPTDQGIIWSKSQTARFWGRCERTIDRWVDQGLIPAPIRIGAATLGYIAREQHQALARMIAQRDQAA
jgi:predicted DNA-binding transcriptional regulator AlpA